MSLTASAPPLLPGGPRRPRRSWRRPAVWVSAMLHLGLLAALLLWGRPRPLPTPAAPEAVEVVFENPAAPQEAASAPADAPTPPEPPDQQAPPAPPVPPAAPQPAPAQPALAPPPAEAPPRPEPPQPAPAEAPPQPAPAPTEAMPQQPPPQAALPRVPEAELPSPQSAPAQELDTRTELAAPTPFRLDPPQLPPAPSPAPPSARPATPFAGTIDLGRSIPLTFAPQQTPRQRSAPGQGVAMALGPVPERSLGPSRRAPDTTGSLTYLSGARPTIDWAQAFQRWVQQRVFYPPQAAQSGEDGAVVLQVTVQKDGSISAVRVTTSSGSRWLDSASLSFFRNQIGPAFPVEMRDEQDSITLTFTTYYILH